MSVKFYAEGDNVDYTPPAAMAAGAAVKFGTQLGAAANPIAANTKGALRVNGIFVVDMVADEYTGLYPVAIGTEADYDFTGQTIKKAGAGDADVKVFLAEAVTSATATKTKIWINKIG